MEDVRAVLVDVDAFDILGIDVARNVGPLVDHQHLFPGVCRLTGEGRAKEPRPHNQVIILHERPSPFCHLNLIPLVMSRRR